MRTEPTLVIVSGLPGSGKTTLAQRLASEMPAVRLNPDDWMAAMGVSIWDDEFRDKVEQVQRSLSADLLRCGTSCIIEWGTWATEERQSLQQLARAARARVELIVLDPPLDTLWERVATRALEDPPMSRDDLERAFELFQRPNAAEAAMYDEYSYIDR